jgi:hypothetical protein
MLAGTQDMLAGTQDMLAGTHDMLVLQTSSTDFERR